MGDHVAKLLEIAKRVEDARYGGLTEYLNGREHTELREIAAALSQPVAEAVDGDWYTSAFGSHCIDFDQDPENQLSLLLKRDGTVSAVATRNGTDTSGGHGLDEVADVIRGWAAPAVAQPEEEKP